MLFPSCYANININNSFVRPDPTHIPSGEFYEENPIKFTRARPEITKFYAMLTAIFLNNSTNIAASTLNIKMKLYKNEKIVFTFSNQLIRRSGQFSGCLKGRGSLKTHL